MGLGSLMGLVGKAVGMGVKHGPKIGKAFGKRDLGFFFEINLNSFLFSIISYFFFAIIVSPEIVF